MCRYTTYRFTCGCFAHHRPFRTRPCHLQPIFSSYAPRLLCGVQDHELVRLPARYKRYAGELEEEVVSIHGHGGWGIETQAAAAAAKDEKDMKRWRNEKVWVVDERPCTWDWGEWEREDVWIVKGKETAMGSGSGSGSGSPSGSRRVGEKEKENGSDDINASGAIGKEVTQSLPGIRELLYKYLMN